MTAATPERKALVTGITGQDGSYLAELLLDKGYEVHGIVRRSSSFNTDRIDHLYRDPARAGRPAVHPLRRPHRLRRAAKLIYELQPDEIYHLGAQSHVRVSFDIPEYTFDVTGAGTLRLLEAIREAGVPAPLLPGVLVRDVRRGAPAAVGDDAVPPAQPVRRRQGGRLLGDRELPRGVRHVRRERHPLQPREPAPRRDLRHPQDHPRRRPHQGRPSGQALPRQPRRQARLGLRPGLRRGDVADAPADEPRRLRDRHGRDALGARVPRGRLRARRARLGGARGDRSALLPPRRGRRPARRRAQGPRARSAGSRRWASTSSCGSWSTPTSTALEDQLAGKVTRYSHES